MDPTPAGARSSADGPLDERADEQALEVVTDDGASLHLVARGSGPAVLLVHGASLSSRIWIRQLSTLPEHGVRVVALDQRGHGRSTVGADGWSVERFGRDLRDVLEELDLDGAVVVGHSMGGIAVQQLVLAHPAVVARRVSGIGLVSTTARPHLGLSRRIRLASRRTSGFDPARVMARRRLGTWVARIGFGRSPDPRDVELVRRLLASCPAETSHEAVRVIFGFDATGDLARLDVPTLVVGGTRDVITPPADARRLAASIPGARLTLLDGAGHLPMLERAAQLDDLLVELVASAGGRAGS